MQVHLRIYSNGKLYDSFAVNAEEGCFKLETDLVSSHHEILDGPAQIYQKIFQIELTILETNSFIVMHIPIHQSTEWEIIKGTDIYTIGFFCILGKQDRELVKQ